MHSPENSEGTDVIQAIILNGGSSSGKTTIATTLQDILSSPWLRFSIDTLIDAMPKALLDAGNGITFGADGSVHPGPEFRQLESAWMRGIAAMIHAGARIIIDDVFVSGVDARNRWRTALAGVSVLWVGVRCDPSVAAERERGRDDHIQGMATLQALMVHAGIEYNMEVDTTGMPALECARLIATRVGNSDPRRGHRQRVVAAVRRSAALRSRALAHPPHACSLASSPLANWSGVVCVHGRGTERF